MKTVLTALAIVASLGGAALAHDTWVETNVNLVRTGDAAYVDLKLGNHGNEHRDFKLASKIDLEKVTLHVLGPNGLDYDLKSDLIDTGYAPKEGYWSAKFVTPKPGLYCVSHTLDTLHRTTRAIKSGKTYFAASNSLDVIKDPLKGFDAPLGHPIEFVPEANPILPMGPGEPIRLKLLYKDRLLAGAVVTFIPRGTDLKEGFDETYERRTDAEGRASFTPKTGGHYLAVTHHVEENEKGDGYDRTAYAATLTVFVPEICPCCE